MRRVVSLYLPNWPIDRLRRRLGAAAPPPDAPTVLVGRDRRRRIITACNPSARLLGLRPGLAAAQAHALAPGLLPFDADPEGDAVGLERLALWAHQRYAPVCAADPSDGVAIDATGATHLRGGEAAFLADLENRLTSAGVHARAAIAPTYGAAHAVARFTRGPAIVAEGEIGRRLGALPLAALRLSEDLRDSLGRLGFETILDVERQPRAPLTLRFGPELGRRLDQTFGRTSEPIVPVVDETQPRAERVFAEPIGAPETIARYIDQLVEVLTATLERDGLGARGLDLLCHRVDNRIEAVRVATARAIRDRKRITRLLHDRIEAIAPGFGIERMTLVASIVQPLDWRPADTRFGEADVPDISNLVDVLSNRIGPGRLYRLTAVESDVPERAVRRAAPLETVAATGWTQDWPRPVRLFQPPEPVETMALLPDNPPTHFTWRGVRRRIRRADGPERIYGEWARRDAELWAVRDYFQVEDDAGERFWLFRAGDGEDARTGSQAWFIHGKFG
ncbi:MAG: nucleotidyltransferase [Brevundimonas sp.]|uniref:Y-family DNA polymerase n=1 Tax=Brevundimonas sp. TaxID=1871086 RepID=UPI000DB0CCBC|nr:DNA polymerase Y family protein [Brevundimonas sp.]PZU01497.1 MAG: nucleotidyltransferase [Brevundimonas sp.]